MLEAQSADCKLVCRVCVCGCVSVYARICLSPAYVNTLLMRIIFTEEVSLSFMLSCMPPHIHTHPTSLTAICPVINLIDTLCNIEYLTALHQICVCVCVFACLCCLCIHPSVFYFTGLHLCHCDPNGGLCSCLCCCDVI